MPIYEYICLDCENKYEKLVRSITAKIEPTCPECGSQHCEKLISAFGSFGSGSKSGDFSLGSSSASDCGPVG